MRKPEQSPEPSIEEILASIRKIIADDGGQPTARPMSSQQAMDTAPPMPSRREPVQPHQGGHFYPEPREVGTRDEEILELTEDFMVEDASGSAAAVADLSAGAEDRDVLSAAGADRPPPSGQELESVLSSVVAEVQRLSGTPSGLAGGSQSAEDDWQPATAAPSRTPRQPTAERRPRPDPELRATPHPAELYPAQPPQPARGGPASPTPQQRSPAKPIWSARGLGSEGAPRRPVPSRPEPPAAKAEAAPRSAPTAGERWAEGVQMPVPETGPTVPFQQPIPDQDPEPPVSGSGEVDAEIEKEKTFVGEMLTRVFGGTKRAEEPKKAEAPQPETARVAKAEELAKTTISDFASEKLRAPTLADALHADKPFMDAITDSLATAMAETEEEQSASVQASAAAPVMLEDELPESLLPPDADLGFDVPPGQAHGMPGGAMLDRTSNSQPSLREARTPSFGAPPEPPLTGAGQDLSRAHAEMFRQETEIAAAPAAPTRITMPEPVATTLPTPDLASPISALPPGIEDTIKELIKPLIVQWLNENLSRIVEKAVREELADHGLTARSDRSFR